MYSSVGTGGDRDRTFCTRTRWLGDWFARGEPERYAGAILRNWYAVVCGHTPVEPDVEEIFPYLQEKQENEITATQMRAAFWCCWITIYISRLARN